MAEFDFTALGIQIGGSGAIGFLIGFAAKKVAKIIAIIVGLELVLFRYLESRGILRVDWNRLTNGIVDAGEAGKEQGQEWIVTFVSTAGVGAGFAGGFFLGFKKA